MDQSLVDLERCPFLRPLAQSAPPPGEPSTALRCWAGGQAREVGTADQRDRCFTSAHARCPALSAALTARAPAGWTANGRAARVVSEACYLAEAQLEVRHEQFGPALARVFGGDP
jgi:hypothetical protein